MKTNRCPRWAGPSLVVLLLVALVGCPPPEAPNDEPPPVDPAAEEERIREVMNETHAAVIAQNWEAAERHLVDDWMLFNNGERMDWAEHQALFEDHITDHRSELHDMEVRVSDDGTMAWARFEEETEFRFDDRPVQQEALFTAIFHRVDGDWRMAHLHRSTPAAPPPQD